MNEKKNDNRLGMLYSILANLLISIKETIPESHNELMSIMATNKKEIGKKLSYIKSTLFLANELMTPIRKLDGDDTDVPFENQFTTSIEGTPLLGGHRAPLGANEPIDMVAGMLSAFQGVMGDKEIDSLTKSIGQLNDLKLIDEADRKRLLGVKNNILAKLEKSTSLELDIPKDKKTEEECSGG